MAKTLLTPELQADIVDLLTVGMTIEDTCASVGINKTTYYDWVKKGERGWKNDEIYANFANAVTRARVEARKAAVVTIRKAMREGDTQAAQWYLERSDPAHWGKRTYIEGNMNVAFVNRVVRALAQAGLEPSEVFENLIAEVMNAHQSVDSEKGD